MIKTEQPANKVTRLFDYSAGRFSVSARDGEYSASVASENLLRARRKISLSVNITFYKYARLCLGNAGQTR